ncbi:hypothetical protein Zmor_012239 [Zophobas morio]|jgi:hypothetical protein|uniref:Lipoprotein n=1 Tax=Zophobas morio TaxID=2755281 RepID=A0AA38LZD8_9CUCU|nr:hypothetical protein Zmor_012239 [Zophobas morio]
MMKKLLSLLGAIGLVATSSATVVACAGDSEETDKPDSDLLKDLFNTDIDITDSSILNQPMQLAELVMSEESGNDQVFASIQNAFATANPGSDEEFLKYRFENADGNVIDFDPNSDQPLSENASAIYIEFISDINFNYNNKDYTITKGMALKFNLVDLSTASFSDLFVSNSIAFTNDNYSDFLSVLGDNTKLAIYDGVTENGYTLTAFDKNNNEIDLSTIVGENNVIIKDEFVKISSFKYEVTSDDGKVNLSNDGVQPFQAKKVTHSS